MSVSLKKGQKISLSKESAGLSKVIVGLGWDEVQQKRIGLFSKKPQQIDCDASAILLRNGHVLGNEDIVYFGNLNHNSGSVKHMGDNLTGEGVGDDEQIIIELSKVPADVDRIVMVVNIYKALERNQHFGLIHNAFIRIVNAANGIEMCRYNLTDDYTGKTALVFGEVYKNNGEWKFNAVGQGTEDTSLGELVKRYH